MKKSLRSIACSLALLAFGTIVLHSAHMDAGHLGNASSHPCAACQVTPSADVPVLDAGEPLSFDSSPVFLIGTLVSSAYVLTGADSRGPPLA